MAVPRLLVAAWLALAALAGCTGGPTARLSITATIGGCPGPVSLATANPGCVSGPAAGAEIVVHALDGQAADRTLLTNAVGRASGTFLPGRYELRGGRVPPGTSLAPVSVVLLAGQDQTVQLAMDNGMR